MVSLRACARVVVRVGVRADTAWGVRGQVGRDRAAAAATRARLVLLGQPPPEAPWLLLSAFDLPSACFSCEIQKWSVAGELRIGIFALRDVRSGQEITIDYRFTHFTEDQWKCCCGEPTCTGVMGPQKKKKRGQVGSAGAQSAKQWRRQQLQLLRQASLREWKARPGRFHTLSFEHVWNSEDDARDAAFLLQHRLYRKQAPRNARKITADRQLCGEALVDSLSRKTSDGGMKSGGGGVPKALGLGGLTASRFRELGAFLEQRRAHLLKQHVECVQRRIADVSRTEASGTVSVGNNGNGRVLKNAALSCPTTSHRCLME